MNDFDWPKAAVIAVVVLWIMAAGTAVSHGAPAAPDPPDREQRLERALKQRNDALHAARVRFDRYRVRQGERLQHVALTRRAWRVKALELYSIEESLRAALIAADQSTDLCTFKLESLRAYLEAAEAAS